MFWVAIVVTAVVVTGVAAYVVYSNYEDSINKKHSHYNQGTSGNGEGSVMTYEDVKISSKQVTSRGKPISNNSERDDSVSTIRERRHKKDMISDTTNDEYVFNNRKAPTRTSDNPPNEKSDSPQKEPRLMNYASSDTEVRPDKKVNLRIEPQESIDPDTRNYIQNTNDSINSRKSYVLSNSSDTSSDSSDTSSDSSFELDGGFDMNWDINPPKTWREMSSRDKSNYLCNACDDLVTTLTIPCEHPFMCDDCAVHFYHLEKCPGCQKDISGYENIM